jgi:hypothetical protein
VSEHVDGEQEQLERLQSLVRGAVNTWVLHARRPAPEPVVRSIEWLVREAFRAGYRHAHDRHTVVRDLWAEDEVTADGRTQSK